jgi:hypothetical protein
LDLVKKEISESVRKTEINRPATATVAENEQKETQQIQRPVWLPRPHIRKSQSRGMGI